MSIVPVITWLLPFYPEVPNSSNTPAWTISTLFFWYLWFPFIFDKLMRLQDEELARSMVKCFWLQIIIPFVIISWFTASEGNNWPWVQNKTKNSMINDHIFNHEL